MIIVDFHRAPPIYKDEWADILEVKNDDVWGGHQIILRNYVVLDHDCPHTIYPVYRKFVDELDEYIRETYGEYE